MNHFHTPSFLEEHIVYFRNHLQKATRIDLLHLDSASPLPTNNVTLRPRRTKEVVFSVSTVSRSASYRRCTVSQVKGKGTVHPCTGPGVLYIGGVEVQLYPFMTTALEGSEWTSSYPGRYFSRERPGTHCTGGWVGPRDGLDRCGKSRPHRNSIPGPSNP